MKLLLAAVLLATGLVSATAIATHIDGYFDELQRIAPLMDGYLE